MTCSPRRSGVCVVALEALHDEHVAPLHKYGHSAQDAPPGARPVQLRMFYIPDEPAAGEPAGDGPRPAR